MVRDRFLHASALALVCLGSGTLDPTTEGIAQAGSGGCVQELRMLFQSTSSPSALEFKVCKRDTIKLNAGVTCPISTFLESRGEVGVEKLPARSS